MVSLDVCERDVGGHAAHPPIPAKQPRNMFVQPGTAHPSPPSCECSHPEILLPLYQSIHPPLPLGNLSKSNLVTSQTFRTSAAYVLTATHATTHGTRHDGTSP